MKKRQNMILSGPDRSMARAHATKYFDRQRASNSALRPGGRAAQRQTRAPIALAQRAKRRVEAMRPCAPRATPSSLHRSTRQPACQSMSRFCRRRGSSVF